MYRYLLVLLVGCAASPADVRQTEITGTLEKQGTVETLSLCVARGLEDKMRVRTMIRNSPGYAEIVAESRGELSGFSEPIYVIDFKGNSSISVTYYVSGWVIGKQTANDMIRDIIKSC